MRFKKTTNDPLVRFYNSIKSPKTKIVYEDKLKKILCEWLGPVLKGNPEKISEQMANSPPKKTGMKRSFSDTDFEDRVIEFVECSKKDNDWSEGVLIMMLDKLKQRTRLEKTNPEYLKPISIRNYFFPIQKLLVENKVNLAWKSLHRLFPEELGDEDTRSYVLNEIQKMKTRLYYFNTVD